MDIELIGEWAGKVWNALDNSEDLDIKALRRATKLKEKELYAAFGWLGREGKLAISTNEAGELRFALVK